uniref:Uncharacterized protein n=1 Tax=Pectinophora gossypiella TaxID=13191 RepID=A0A1E1W0T4_PECGO
MAGHNLLQWNCKSIRRAMKSSPTNALQIECVEAPLQLRRQFLSDRYYFNIIQNSSHPLHNKIRSLNSLTNLNYWTHKDLPLLINSYKKIDISTVQQTLKNPIFEFNFNILIFCPKVILNLEINKNSPGANAEFNRISERNWPGWLHLYTDASKISDSDNVGAAVWIPKYKIILNYKCPPKCSIFTDSLSCLQDIIKKPFHSKDNFYLTLKIKEVLFKCQQSGIEVILAWIPSHSGITGNEIADQCAKEAIRTGREVYNKQFSRDIRCLAKPHLHKSWTERWNNSRLIKGKHYGGIQPFVPIKPWFFKYRNFDKPVCSTIIRLRLGHVCSPVFLAKLRIRDHSLCECGEEEGTLDHLFFNCPRLNVSLYDVLPPKIPRPVNVNFLLTLVYTPFINILSRFIKYNNIKL